MFENLIPTQNFLNSKYWKEVRKKTGNKIVDVDENLWIQTTKIPLFNKSGGYIPRADISNIDFDKLKSVAKNNGIFFIKIDPSNNESTALKESAKLSKPVQYQHTTVLNLEQNEEEFLSKLKSKHRYNLKVAQKNAVRVEISDSNEAFDTFIDLYKKTTLRQGYTGRSSKYLETVFKTLKEFNKDLVYIATAYFEDRAVSSWMLFVYEDTIIYPYGGSSDENRNVMATYSLVYEIFKWGKHKGKKYFDLFGIDEKNPDSGYSRFKLGFGGEQLEFANTFDIVYNRFFYFFYKIWERFNR